MFRVRLASSDVTGNEVVAARTPWLHAPQNQDLENWTFNHLWYRYPAVRSDGLVRLELYDPNNADAYIQAGRLIIGKALDTTARVASGGVNINFEETGGEVEARGGQIYRARNAKRRVLSVHLQYTTEAEAIGELLRLQRIAGRSQPVFAVLDQTETTYGQEYSIYGFLDPGPITHQFVNLYETTLNIRELL